MIKKCEVQVAERKRRCKNSNAAIAKGESCFVVWDNQYDRSNYSVTVALQMIADARAALDGLKESLTSDQQ
ncbi:MAG TPA: hypothetical protein VK581_07550 [Chthoniobacterales bacterium]|nr:hypothetical protein [Chthoniobacterales bacterium]